MNNYYLQIGSYDKPTKNSLHLIPINSIKDAEHPLYTYYYKEEISIFNNSMYIDPYIKQAHALFFITNPCNIVKLNIQEEELYKIYWDIQNCKDKEGKILLINIIVSSFSTVKNLKSAKSKLDGQKKFKKILTKFQS